MIVMSCHFDPLLLIAPVGNTLEAAYGLLEQPLDHARIVVAKANNVIQRGKAMWLAGLLHLVQLRSVKFMVLDCSGLLMKLKHEFPFIQMPRSRIRGSSSSACQRGLCGWQMP
jgi:hypothetical protein